MVPRFMKQLLASILFCLSLIPNRATAQTVTWADNIACILYTNCTKCHNPTGIGPFDLLTYDDAENYGFLIEAAVNSGDMPPWPPNEEYNSLAHERVLTQEEIGLINDWIAAGMPEGNPMDAPMEPIYTNNEVITSPDLIIEMPEFTVFSNSDDMYQCFPVATGLSEDMYISGFEVVPGNPNIVHHALVFADTSSVVFDLDAADPNVGYTSFGGTGSSSSKLIGLWVPGEEPFFYPTGMGAKIPAGANIIIQVHYPAGSAGQTDQTKINFDLESGGNIREVFMAAALEHTYTLTDGPLIIPPNVTQTFHNEFQVPTVPIVNAITTIAVAPHMHLIGKSIKSFAVTPTNDTVPFFDIPEWDFHYQGFYKFRQPVVLPSQTMLYGEATYDNTASNPNNPNDPPAWVFLGEATEDEMFLIYFAYTYYLPGDENIVVDTATVKPTYLDCDFTFVGLEDHELDAFSIYPNPTTGPVTIDLNGARLIGAELLDIKGRKIKDLEILNGQVDVGGVPTGTYLLTLRTESGSARRPIVIR